MVTFLKMFFIVIAKFDLVDYDIIKLLKNKWRLSWIYPITLLRSLFNGLDDSKRRMKNSKMTFAYCDKCNCCITEDDLNMSIDFSCGKLLCESCLDTFSEEPNEEIEKLKKENKELKHKLDCVEADLEEHANIVCELKELISQMKQLLSL